MSENKILLTIAIPFYNAERYLAQAIDSVIAQTYTYWILQLVDDGSSDESLRIAQTYAEKDSRIIVYSDGENKNLGFRLNQIAQMCNTEYLARMDADDIMRPERLDKQLNILLKNPEIDVLGTNAYSINESDQVIGIRNMSQDDKKLQATTVFIHPTVMARTTWFQQNPYDVKAERIEDAELWNRTKDKSIFMATSEPLLFYREYNGNYYMKYWNSIPSALYVSRKNRYKLKYVKRVLMSLIKTVVYFVFERILRSSFLLNRRNAVIYSTPKSIEDLL